MRLKFLPALAAALILCSCAHRKEIPATPSAAGLSKSATPAERLKHFFPPGIDWSNASPDQISEAVLAAVKIDPENAVDITTTAIDGAIQSGRFPKLDRAEAKTFIDPEPKRTLFDVLFPKRKAAQ